MTVRDLLAGAARRLGHGDARLEAELLLAHALGKSRAWLYAWPEHEPDAGQAHEFHRLLDARIGGEPIAYLMGQREFRSIDLAVTPDVLIPRHETELLVDLALTHIPRDAEFDVADLGTGSGAIAIAIASERPHARVLATDASEAALRVARGNAERLHLGNIEFAHGDWCAALADRRFDVIVSNPPYIAEDDPHLVRGDLVHEPRGALASGKDGLDAIRAISSCVPAHLRNAGWLLIEHGLDQGEAVGQLLRDRGFVDVATARDLEQRDRVTAGRWPN